jgi:lysophospholipase L1-like esterase
VPDVAGTRSEQKDGPGGGASRFKSVVRVAVANIAVVVILLSAIEGYFRVSTAEDFFFLFSEPRMRLDERAFVTAHPSRGFVLRSGYSDDQIQIDQRGFRAGASKGRADPSYTILALGESTTFGWDVPQGSDYPAQLAAAFDSGTESLVRVLNGGVPSYSSTQVAITLEELAEEGLRADLVLISIMWNDIYYSATPNWYPDLLVYQQPPMWRRLLFRHSATFRHLARLRLDRLGEIDRPNPEALEHFSRTIERILAAQSRSMGRVVFVEPPFCRAQLDASGMRGLGVLYSPRFLTERVEEYSERVRLIAGRRGSMVINHRLSALYDAPAGLFLDMAHPTAEGNGIMARDIADGLVAAGLVDAL